MSYKNRWSQPTEREPRDEYYALRKELKTRALTKSRRAEIETRLDDLALNPDFKGTLQEKSILSDVPPAKPTTQDLLALCDRAKAAREGVQQKSILHEEAPSDGTEPDWKEVPRPSRMWNVLEFRCLVLLQDLQARGYATRPCFASDAALHLYWKNSIGFTFEDLDRIEKAFIDAAGELPVDDKQN